MSSFNPELYRTNSNTTSQASRLSKIGGGRGGGGKFVSVMTDIQADTDEEIAHARAILNSKRKGPGGAGGGRSGWTPKSVGTAKASDDHIEKENEAIKMAKKERAARGNHSKGGLGGGGHRQSKEDGCLIM